MGVVQIYAVKRIFGQRMTAVILKTNQPLEYPGPTVAMFTCRDGKGGELRSRASKMLYKPPGAVYIAS